jgi:RNA polymerase sigma-70 factor, ECF subfamily
MTESRSSAARAAADRSFEELYRGHRADVFRAALRELGNVHDAEDVTQAAFVDAYRAVLRGSEPHAPRAWLLAIAENVRRRRFRVAQRRPREEPIDADFPLTAELSHELARALAEALADLPAAERRAFVLRELAGRSYEEIAAETGTTVGAVQMQLFRARSALREQLDPPQVAVRRRAGLLVPLPGWLTTLATRADVSVLAPRAAGAAGAAVLAVAGATVAVKELEGGGPPAAPLDSRPAAVSTGRPADRAADPVARRPVPEPEAATAEPPAPTRTASLARTAAVPSPAAVPAVPAVPVAPAAPEPAPALAPAVPAAASPAVTVVQAAAEPVRTAVDGVKTTLERPPLPAGPPAGKVKAPLDPPRLPPLQSPVPEAASGAAGAVGKGAAPLPVPGVPPVTVPPAP